MLAFVQWLRVILKTPAAAAAASTRIEVSWIFFTNQNTQTMMFFVCVKIQLGDVIHLYGNQSNYKKKIDLHLYILFGCRCRCSISIQYLRAFV